ncbi:MAG TPA: CRTAC1 family protein [Pirellulaceae bacterium]|nr:CRTAC1 family protein [Pirellulaceae bacterium]
MDRFKRGAFFSKEFVAGTTTGTTNWNGFEHNLLFERVGNKKFADVARPTGCDAIEDSRGVAIADLNGDGLLDIVINNNNAAPAIYLNRVVDAGNWVQMKLLAGPACNRDAIGTRVQLRISKDGQSQTLTRWVEAGTGYAAQSDMRVHFGLGDAQGIESVSVRWPDGTEQKFEGGTLAVTMNGNWEIEQGSGIIAQPQVTEVASRFQGE